MFTQVQSHRVIITHRRPAPWLVIGPGTACMNFNPRGHHGEARTIAAQAPCYSGTCRSNVMRGLGCCSADVECQIFGPACPVEVGEEVLEVVGCELDAAVGAVVAGVCPQPLPFCIAQSSCPDRPLPSSPSPSTAITAPSKMRPTKPAPRASIGGSPAPRKRSWSTRSGDGRLGGNGTCGGGLSRPTVNAVEVGACRCDRLLGQSPMRLMRDTAALRVRRSR